MLNLQKECVSRKDIVYHSVESKTGITTIGAQKVGIRESMSLSEPLFVFDSSKGRKFCGKWGGDRA